MPRTTIAGPHYDGLHVSREQYLDLADDGYQYDVVEGVMRMSPSPDFEHNDLNLSFGVLLKIYLKKNPIGKCAIETDVFLPDGGDPLRPDLSFILNEKLRIVQKHIHGAPDLVCEVLSPTTRKRDLGVKADRYLKNGVLEYWILDPENQSISVWKNQGNQSWNQESADVLQSVLLPGFAVQKIEFFG